jgi:geranylgeranyl diphosphate synthase type I
MAGGKTGALLAGAASLGAILAGGPRAAVRELHAFGAALGLAFQAVDDWLGIWGRPDRTGKPVASDLRQRKASLPIVLALGTPCAAAEELRELLGGDAEEELVCTRGAELVEACGAERRTRDVAEQQIGAARRALARAPIAETTREELAELAGFVVEREF